MHSGALDYSEREIRKIFETPNSRGPWRITLGCNYLSKVPQMLGVGSATVSTEGRPRCPKCGSWYVYRQPRRGFFDAVEFQLFGRKPYYCDECNKHFYLKAKAKPSIHWACAPYTFRGEGFGEDAGIGTWKVCLPRTPSVSTRILWHPNRRSRVDARFLLASTSESLKS